MSGWRRWLIDTIGPDYVGSVTHVDLGTPTSTGPPTEEDLAKIGRLARLEYLSLKNLGSARRTLDQIRNLKRLKYLALVEKDGTKEGSLDALKDFAELEQLRLTLSWIGDADLVPIAGLTGLDRLTLGSPILDASGANTISNAGLVHLAGLTRLTQLWLRAEKVTSLEPIRDFVDLGILSVSGTSIDDAGAAPIAGFTRLGVLYIESKFFTNAGLAHLRGMPRLNQVSVRGAAIDDGGVSHLIAIPNLVRLFLTSTSVTDAGLLELAKRPRPGLIDVTETKVTPEGIAAARAIQPKATIIAKDKPGASGVSRPVP